MEEKLSWPWKPDGDSNGFTFRDYSSVVADNVRLFHFGHRMEWENNLRFEHAKFTIEPNGHVELDGFAHFGKLTTQKGMASGHANVIIGMYDDQGRQLGVFKAKLTKACNDEMRRHWRKRVEMSSGLYFATKAVRVTGIPFSYWYC